MAVVNDSLRGVAEIVKGFAITLKNLVQGPLTWEYPEQPVPVYPRFRARHELRRYENGLERCIGCMLCEAACPTNAIHVEAAENDPAQPDQPRRALRQHLGSQPAPLHLLRRLRNRLPRGGRRPRPRVRDRDLHPRGLSLDQEELLEPTHPNVVVRAGIPRDQ